jgi:hypothetical protein
MADEVARFMTANAPETDWLLADPDGGWCLSLGGHVQRRRRRAPGAGGGASPTVSVFSDLHQWLLKVLLLREAPEPLWAGPRPAVERVVELAAATSVSVPKAYQFARVFQDRGWLRRGEGGLRVVRSGELLDAWFAHQQLQPARRWFVRGRMGPLGGALDGLSGRVGPLGGFEACRRLELAITPGGLPELHVTGAVEAALAEHEWELCDERDAELVLLSGRAPESVRRGCLLAGGVLVVDPLQAALDVAGHAARGREQADYLRARVLAWQTTP